MFAKDLSNKIFSPPRHEDTKTRSLIIINIYYLCLGAFVAILPGLSGSGYRPAQKYIEGRDSEQKTIDPVKNAPMAGENLTGILYTMISF